MSLVPGDRLDHYEIEESIGIGGMGEVYRAKDTRLPRDVAIKVAGQNFTERFSREAKVIAALNHPNICTLYDVGPNYLVMELVEGPTLEDRIKEGDLGRDEAYRLARQIADALDYAHERGVIHRDLKPANIKVRPDGVVKVLDFGLAKIGHADSSDATATVTMGATQAGMILGTPAYMAPEQAKGKPADKRADVWAFGVVLYEMLAGGKPFGGATVQEALASTLRDDPDLNKVPAEARRLLRRCLEKDPQSRLRHIGDVMSLIDEAPPTGKIAATSAGPGWMWPAVAALGVLAAIVMGAVHFREKAPEVQTTRFQFNWPEGVTLPPGSVFSISPDGRNIVFTGADSGGRKLWLRSLDSMEARPIHAGLTGNIFSPFWSPDSRFVVIGQGSTLLKVDLAGGPPQTLCGQCGAAGGSWHPDGTILLGNGGGGIMRVPAAGGTPAQVTAPKPGSGDQHAYPTLLPDGKHFLYLRLDGRDRRAGVSIGSLDVKPEQQDSKVILETPAAVAWMPAPGSSTGQLLYLSDYTLLARPFDAAKLAFAGDPVQVLDQVGRIDGSAWGTFDISANGTLVYRGRGSSAQQQLNWVDRSGKVLGPVGEPGQFNTVVLNPDGTRAALVLPDPKIQNDTDIWIADLKAGTRTRLTFEPGDETQPIWSPDGSRIVYNASREASARGPQRAFGFFQRASNGAAGEQLVYQFPPGPSPNLTHWSPDGTRLLFHSVGQKTKMDLWTLPLAGKEPVPFLQTEFLEIGARFSPDGRWIVYRSDESGRNEVYVQPAPGSPAPPGKFLISNGGSVGMARWRKDGRELYYLTGDGVIMAVDIAPGVAFQASQPRKLFDVPAGFKAIFAPGAGNTAPGALADATPDGQRFLFAIPMEQSTTQPFNVVVGWNPASRP